MERKQLWYKYESHRGLKQVSTTKQLNVFAEQSGIVVEITDGVLIDGQIERETIILEARVFWGDAEEMAKKILNLCEGNNKEMMDALFGDDADEPAQE